MTTKEFNTKWTSHLSEGYYGLDIENQSIINYCDILFTRLHVEYPNFKYFQIKVKFGMGRAYIDTIPQKDIQDLENFITLTIKRDN